MDESINISPEIPELHDPDAPEIDDDLKEVEVGESNEQLTTNKFFSKQQVYYIGICLQGFILLRLLCIIAIAFIFKQDLLSNNGGCVRTEKIGRASCRER